MHDSQQQREIKPPTSDNKKQQRRRASYFSSNPSPQSAICVQLPPARGHGRHMSSVCIPPHPWRPTQGSCTVAQAPPSTSTTKVRAVYRMKIDANHLSDYRKKKKKVPRAFYLSLEPLPASSCSRSQPSTGAGPCIIRPSRPFLVVPPCREYRTPGTAAAAAAVHHLCKDSCLRRFLYSARKT